MLPQCYHFCRWLSIGGLRRGQTWPPGAWRIAQGTDLAAESLADRAGDRLGRREFGGLRRGQTWPPTVWRIAQGTDLVAGVWRVAQGTDLAAGCLADRAGDRLGRREFGGLRRGQTWPPRVWRAARRAAACPGQLPDLVEPVRPRQRFIAAPIFHFYGNDRIVRSRRIRHGQCRRLGCGPFPNAAIQTGCRSTAPGSSGQRLFRFQRTIP